MLHFFVKEGSSSCTHPVAGAVCNSTFAGNSANISQHKQWRRDKKQHPSLEWCIQYVLPHGHKCYLHVLSLINELECFLTQTTSTIHILVFLHCCMHFEWWRELLTSKLSTCYNPVTAWYNTKPVSKRKPLVRIQGPSNLLCWEKAACNWAVSITVLQDP